MLLCSSMLWKATIMSQGAEKNVDGCGGKSFTYISVWGGGEGKGDKSVREDEVWHSLQTQGEGVP